MPAQSLSGSFTHMPLLLMVLQPGLFTIHEAVFVYTRMGYNEADVVRSART